MRWVDQSNASGVLRRAIAESRPIFIFTAVFSALLNLLYLAPTLYMMQVYDRAIPTGGRMTLALLTVVTLTALAVLSALEWVRSRLLIHASTRLEFRLSGKVMDAVLRRPGLTKVERSAAMREFDTFRQSLAGPVPLAIFDIPWTPVYLLVGFMVHPAIGILGLVSGALLLTLALLNERATRDTLQGANRIAGQVYTEEDYASRSADTVRALGMRGALVAKQLEQRRAMINLQNRASFAAGGYLHLIKGLRLSLQSVALGLGAWLAIQHAISPGAIFAASFLLARMLAPIEQVVGAWKSIVLNREAYQSLSKLLDEPRSTGLTKLPAPVGLLSVEGLAVAGAGADRTILRDISFQVQPGTMVGVIGPSGAGKTTLARVLAGASLADRGAVRLDGASYGDWDPEEMARHVGYLPQDFVLFAGSVKDNISRFRGHLNEPGVDIDAMTIKAAKAAGAHDLILRLPGGYDSMIGLGGAGLSAGQAQRVALARALFGDPRLIILDEPNAHLDAEGEAMLTESLCALRDQGRTIIVVAHRSGVLAAANKLLTLRAGRVEMFGDLKDVAEAMRAARPQTPETAAPNRMRA